MEDRNRNMYIPTGSWNWAQNIQDFLAGICVRAEGESERPSSIPISVWLARRPVRPSIRVEPPPAPAEGARGSHRSSDYRFPGGGPRGRGRT